MFNNFKKILILAPHTDDGEFGCGGTIAKFIEEKKEIFYVGFSAAEESIPKEFPKNTTKKEFKNATKILNIPSKNLTLFNYPVRKFPKYRQNILDDMIRLDKKIKPDLIILPSTYDTHQDHQVIAQEGFRAFKTISMLGYEVLWNNLTFNTTAFVLLEKKHLQKKIQAIKCYKSQSKRNYTSGELIRSLAITRGRQIRSNLYAEAFEVIRWVIH